MYQRVMVPLDGSSFGERAIPFALQIALRTSARLDLVHVHIPPHEEDLFAITPYQFEQVTRRYREWDEADLSHEREQIESLAARISDETGLDVTGRIVSGAVIGALGEEARRFEADLVVMATHARTGLARARMGSIADIVVRRATQPVLLVQPSDQSTEHPVRRIIVALDGSPFSEEALVPATRLARLYDAELLLVHVDDRWGTPLRGYMDELAARLPDARIEITRALNPVDGLLEVADHWAADLFVTATHGRSGVRRAFMGSTASDLIARTHLPVLLHRPAAATAGITAPPAFTP